VALYAWEFCTESQGMAWVAYWPDPLRGGFITRQFIGPELGSCGKEHFNAPPPGARPGAQGPRPGARARNAGAGARGRQDRAARERETSARAAMRTLGITTDAPTWDEIRAAYKRAALANHPDRIGPAGHPKMVLVNLALELLRKHYGQA